MKKKFMFLVLGMILLIASGVFALAGELSPELQGYVTSLAEQGEIASEDIVDVSKVDFNNLPNEIKLENIDIDQTSLAIYQINITGNEPVYVITVSDETFKKTLETVDLKRSYLNFGFSGISSGNKFLKTATGVETSREKGYIMMRSGSITGISTNLEIGKNGGKIEIIIGKNGEPLGFGNTLSATSSGIKTDYDVLSEGTLTFEAGDVISAYLNATEDVAWKDVITMIEITTD